jgi:hypothetical protein
MTVPVKWKILTDDEIETVKNGMGDILFKQSGIPSPIESFLDETVKGSKDEQLFLALQLLNNKLDFIIEQLLSRSSFEINCQDKVIEISASGLKFSSVEKFEEGALIKMELIMPGIVHYNMELIAEIIRTTKKDDQYISAAKIVHIKDEARDSIVKLVFQRQRMDIRNKKNMEDLD